MESQAPAITPATSQSQASEGQQCQQSQPPQPQSSSSAPSVSAPVHSSSNPNPILIQNLNQNQNQNQNQSQNTNSKPPPPVSHQSSPSPPQPRPPTAFNRTLPQQSHYPHFSSTLSSLPPSSGSSSTSTASPSISGAPPPRGGMAIGVPAHHQSPSPPFSSSFGQHFGGLGRTGVNVPESGSSTSPAQVRTSVQGIGMLGSLGSTSQMRPGGIPANQQRPVQSSLRPLSSPNNQSTGSQSFQGHGVMRPSSIASPASPSPSSSQSTQSLNQPWLSSGSSAKPPLPSPSYRQQLNPPSFQHRSHIPPQQLSTPTASQQQQPSSQNPSQEHFGQQTPSSRALNVTHQQQITRFQGSGNQKPLSLVAAQPSPVQPGIQNKLANVDTDESCNRIVSKRSIHELVNQVDPLEKLDPEVTDILVDIAENFLESITRSGCSLAKHRKSTTLEARDVLLHVEKNWNMTLPGFGGDEIKGYRKPLTSDIHKERLAAIKKSVITTESVCAKGYAGQISNSAKGNLAKTAVNLIGSPNLKSS
ncbi:hypothetical protein L6164_033829 [Bauhinia variegata]|uniref:Uncharacterized protein n=1 Tax=Bauhinia variegata TaxID=167791 RepID=A0ACB9KTR0_BAUVA|nr:hypothetical protein L6164_033829 [Bauhinia variegata]